ncbi:hypothetical protein BJ508DRAFT_363018 [Ascobolus immersus RN42]|uniref:C-CAP/cofactor C-like domain-containing protein n=1 Tax=Ascobolus immersus RN42 TaxID=1160509 RepID=A0A3N4I1C7_ASCIM|nr:hypothetical protein BJ508DRAFT_363018 [Ascobolus immersus RN42]
MSEPHPPKLSSQKDEEDEAPVRPATPTIQQQFFTLFQQEHTQLSSQIATLPTLSPTEKSALIAEILPSIASLSSQLNDATSYLPLYDQRQYLSQIKALNDSLAKARSTGSGATKPKFSFKSKKTLEGARDLRPAGAPSPASVSTPAPKTASLPLQTDVLTISAPSSKLSLPPNDGKDYTALYLSNLTGHVLNLLALPTPPSTAALKDITSSLLILPPINGPVHFTNIHDCVIALPLVRQLRLHDSSNLKILLWCGSQPIVEGVKGIQFGRCPSALKKHVKDLPDEALNKYDQVQDFKWLKAEKSPNWDLVDEEIVAPTQLWEEAAALKDEGRCSGLLEEFGVGADEEI